MIKKKKKGLEVGEDFFVALGDGVLLCSIINTIKPGTIAKVLSGIMKRKHTSNLIDFFPNQVNPAGRAKKLPPKRMENINNFIFGARTLGMLKSQLFEVFFFFAMDVILSLSPLSNDHHSRFLNSLKRSVTIVL